MDCRREDGEEGSSRGIVERGVDVEDYFDRIVLKEARGRNVLDIGCGRGEFTLSVAAVATSGRS